MSRPLYEIQNDISAIQFEIRVLEDKDDSGEYLTWGEEDLLDDLRAELEALYDEEAEALSLGEE